MSLKEIKALEDARKRKVSAIADEKTAIDDASNKVRREEAKIGAIKAFIADPTATELNIEDEEEPEKLEIEGVRDPTPDEIAAYVAQLPPREMSEAEIAEIVKEKPSLVDDETLRLLIVRRREALNDFLEKLVPAPAPTEPTQEQVLDLLKTESGRKKLEALLNTDEGQEFLLANLE